MNKYILWETIKWTSYGVLIVFMTYLMIAGFIWILNDSLNLIPDIEVYKDPAIQICENKGGIPIKNGWSGNLSKCNITNIIYE